MDPEATDQAGDGLEALAPRVLLVPFRGEQLEVGPLTVDQVPPIIRRARPIVEAVLELPDNGEGVELAGFAFDLIENHHAALTEAVAIAVGRDRDWIGKGGLAEFTHLVKQILEVNRDFFVQTLGPHLVRAWKQKRGAGPTASRS